MSSLSFNEEVIQASPLAIMIQSCEGVSTESWMKYIQALLAISGADGEISEEEMDWVFTDFLEIIGASDEQKEEIRSFDYLQVNLEELLPNLNIDVPMNFKRTLVYDAVMMAMADNDYAKEEKEAVWKAAELLGIPYFIARTIEGLVNTEKSLGMIRKSLFELEEDTAHPIIGLQSLNMKPASVLERNTFGIKLTCEQTQLNYGYALMIIAGADGIVSDAEKEWYLEQFVTVSETPPHIAEQVVAYDYKSGKLQDVIDNLKVDVTINFKRTLLYNAVKMASADLSFPEQEREASEKVANILGISPDIAQTIHYLVDTEAKISKMRLTLFEYK
ncbi:TerB family tellurite resistance protein [Flammeovirga sp. OC4]|uniref:TerB family tellurite resistance protein n=1 Tax=Flammeovirga sp. OC4 TaxID=1382345 RepID=UPI0005C729B1|nr:TerB family tellurite resistance protein [Flammeovirga sp. OC4]